MAAICDPTSDLLARYAHASRLTLGDAILQDLQSKRGQSKRGQSKRDGGTANQKADVHFQNFIHVLNMNDWLGAAYFLYAGDSQTLQRLVQEENRLLAHLGNNYLALLYAAAEHFDKDRNEWRGQLQEAYQFGTLPAYGPTVINGTPVKAPYIFKSGVAQHGRNLISLMPIFQEYEKINQLYQQPAKTTEGAPIRFTQGHNWSYSHARLDLSDPTLFPPNTKRVLMNWDAHRDLSPPFGHLSRELALVKGLIPHDTDRLLKLVQNASSKEEFVEVAGMMSIAGWILPLLHTKEFQYEDVSELIIVLPKEAQQTSKEDYWPPYGTHEMQIGHTAVDFEEIENFYDLLDALQPLAEMPGEAGEKGKRALKHLKKRLAAFGTMEGFEGVQSVSNDPRLRTVRQSVSCLVQEPRDIKVHIVDPDNLNAILEKIGTADIYLSVDVDYAGTVHLGGWQNVANSIPHYPLNNSPEEEARHLQLIECFETFYRKAAKQIKAVSIANSPDYTADESRRRPASKIMDILTQGTAQAQPGWISGAAGRIAPPRLMHHPFRGLLISVAGALGISLTAALFWHFLRTKNLQRETEA